MTHDQARTVTGTVFAALSFLLVAPPGADAAGLSTAARIERPAAVIGEPIVRDIRHRYRYYGDDFYFGHYPFTLNDYPPYVYAHPPRYRAPSYRSGDRSCRHWSGRCAANWGSGNSNYYGCLRYHGC